MVKKKETIHNHNSYNLFSGEDTDWSRILIKAFIFFIALIVFINLAGLIDNNYQLKVQEINAEKNMFNNCIDACEVKGVTTDYRCVQYCVKVLDSDLVSYAKR